MSESDNVRLSAWEHNLYQAGVKLGHHEGASEAADQLRKASQHYSAHVENQEALEPEQKEAFISWLSIFDKVAEQLEAGATVAKKHASEKMNEAFRHKHRTPPTLPERLKRAIIGAIEGYSREV